MGKRETVELWQQGLELVRQGDFAGAVGVYRQALAEPGELEIELLLYLSEAYFGNDNLLLAAKAINCAVEKLERAENKGSNDFQLLLRMRQGTYNRRAGNIRQAAEGYRQAAELYPENRLYQSCGAYSSYLQTLACLDVPLSELKAVLKGYDRLFCRVRPEIELSEPAPVQRGKIRVGYLSPDFRQHVMFSFYYVMLKNYDRESFYVVCYSLAKGRDGYAEHISSLVDRWREVGDLPAEELVGLIQDDGIDILVDLAGHSAGSGLPVFAFWPAPVQISGLGWMETTGFYAVDYLLTDRYLDGSSAGSYLTEDPLFLTSQFCYAARSDVPTPGQAPCMANGYITFGSFNSYHKLSDSMVAVWSDILRRVPEARLLLKCQVFIDNDVRQQALARFAACGIGADRLLLEPATSDYMERYMAVDIALDTYPYTGGGTTLDALYMGVPVVSLYGERRSSRFGLSILSNGGLPWLAVDSCQAYVELAVQLADNMALVNDLHLHIRKILCHSDIMNGGKYMRELETAYKELAGRDGAGICKKETAIE